MLAQAVKEPSSDVYTKCKDCVQEDVATWGHEYIRSLSGEIGEEYHMRREKGESVEDLLGLVAQIVPFHMTHNAGKLVLSKYQPSNYPTSQCTLQLHS